MKRLLHASISLFASIVLFAGLFIYENFNYASFHNLIALVTC